jgi:hypothetical protein
MVRNIMNKFQITISKLQINSNIQYSKHLGFGGCDLFGTCNLVLGTFK